MSFVERFTVSLFRRVHYRRFHCIPCFDTLPDIENVQYLSPMGMYDINMFTECDNWYTDR